ncbi:MAG: bifunctional hydroxymethylpyrimidine kinase/phosphomethylpyrimidine kinase [Pseudomonadota bacterium]
MTAIALTIAGSDSSGGAGIQADLKTFSAQGVYGASVITALTAQNTLGVTGIHDVPADFVRSQIIAVLSDLKVGAIKIGMLSQAPVIEAVAGELRERYKGPVVLDPVMVATSGDLLIAEDAIQMMTGALFPVVSLITPNLLEAARLTGTSVARDEKEMEAQADALIGMGAAAVLVKGGHGHGTRVRDYLLTSTGGHWFEAERIETKNTHGTGCTLSSAIAAGLAKGEDLQSAVGAAKLFITGAIDAANRLSIGEGSGPTHHFYRWW